jgi:poly(3-hydroxybutyrate) depolymerase
VKHSFIIDLPDNADNAPLVIMLHGYGSSAEDFRYSIQFEKAANPMGYAVVYVTGAPAPL